MKRTWLALPALVAMLACEPVRQDIGQGSHPQSGTVQVSQDGRFVFALSADHEAVLVFDRESRQTVKEIKVGQRPVAMTLLSDGRLAVANRGSNSVSIVNPDTGLEDNQIYVGIEPSAVAARGDKVLATLAIDQKLVEVDPNSGRVTREVRLERSEPAGIAVLKDGTIFVSHFYGSHTEGGRVSVVDLDAGRVINSIFISVPQNQLLKANQLASLTVSPREDEVAAPHQETNNDPGGFGTGSPPVTQAYYVDGPSGMPAVVPAVATFDPRGEVNTTVGEFPNISTCIGCPGASAATPKDPNTLYPAPAVHNIFDTTIFGQMKLNSPVALAYVDGGKGRLVLYRGTNNVVLMRSQHYGNQDAVVAEYPVGKGSDGIAVTPDGKHAYVYSQFDYTLTEIPLEKLDDAEASQNISLFGSPQAQRQNQVLTTQAVTTKASVQRALRPLDSVNLSPEIRRGRELFFGATEDTLTRKGAVSCASCHPNGRSDGMNWTFGTQKIRNTPQLGGGISGTAPFHWEEGDRPDKSSMNQTVQQFMAGVGLPPNDIDALFKFMDTIPRAQSPIADKVEMQDAIARGAAIFFSEEAQCASCHAGDLYTDNKVYGHEDTGTGDLEPYARFNTPVLIGLAVSGPYFHDGRADAATLEALVDNYVATDKMGKGSHLSATQRADLVAFLKSL